MDPGTRPSGDDSTTSSSSAFLTRPERPAEPPARTLAVSAEDYLYFVARALRGMAEIVTRLGDDLAVAPSPVPGGNTAFGLLTHCLGVTAYWGGRVVAGRPIERDREAEFGAVGTASEISAAVERCLCDLEANVSGAVGTAPCANEPDAWALGPDRHLDQGAALVHLYEELSQHHGQLQVLRDALLAAQSTSALHLDPPRLWLRAKQGVKWHRPGPDLLPAWVADMDFPVAGPIRQALSDTVARGDLGYPDWSGGSPLAELFSARMHARYGWQPDPGHVRSLTDLIQGFQVTVELMSGPGDPVVANTPNYPPFLAAIPRMQRRLLAAPMRRDGTTWTWDAERLAADLESGCARILLLVNPQNPTGRVFTRGELEMLAELAARHDLVVISDEIHAELAYDGRPHIPFASLSGDTAGRTVTITSATKAFNIAGLRTAVAHVGSAALRAGWDRLPPDLMGAVNVLGVEATRAAWMHGDEWLAGVRAHLQGQRDYVTERLAVRSDIGYCPPEATYLAWLDFAGVDRREPATAPARYLRDHAGVELSDGAEFGGYESFARLNFATSRPVLTEVLDRIQGALPPLPRLRTLPPVPQQPS